MPSLLPWAAMMSLVVLAALLLDLLAPDGSAPSALLLLAPIVPVLGVGIAWSRLMDPAHDLVASTPRAGLEMVLRRTLAVLSVVMPALFACGWVIGASPAYWLLPCLAVTAVALALSSVVGVRPAALATVLAWAGLVIGPAALTGVSPAVLTPAAAPVWAATLAAGVAAVLLRSARYARS
ncbi:hypothetical protein ACFPM7_15805 [Actinokineospora guangxiensis]|uniref:Uncharacterized protein n=1 Tax=Actinokineospora guangxiensis TaxID=1490288 RepID=A0ABW0EQX1_9PSEU